MNPLSPGNELADRFGHEIVKAYPVINVQYEFPAVSKDSAARLHAAEFASSSLAQVMKIASRAKNISTVLAGNPTFLSAPAQLVMTMRLLALEVRCPLSLTDHWLNRGSEDTRELCSR